MTMPTSRLPAETQVEYDLRQLTSGMDRVAVWAVRYALGRMTYAVSDVVDVMIANSRFLRPETRARIVADIDEAFNKGRVGMEMDEAQWRRLRSALAPALAGG